MTNEPLLAHTMAEMTATKVEAAAQRGAAVLLPVGVMEAHGPHLPIGTDAYIALQLCRLTQKYAAGRKETLIAPPYFWGINAVLSAFTGSFRIRAETAAALLTDIIDSLSGDGFKEVLVVSHHGDRAHNDMILDVAESASARSDRRALALRPDPLEDDRAARTDRQGACLGAVGSRGRTGCVQGDGTARRPCRRIRDHGDGALLSRYG